MGHINVCGANRVELIKRLSQLAEILPESDFPEVKDYIERIQ